PRRRDQDDVRAHPAAHAARLAGRTLRLPDRHHRPRPGPRQPDHAHVQRPAAAPPGSAVAAEHALLLPRAVLPTPADDALIATAPTGGLRPASPAQWSLSAVCNRERRGASGGRARAAA